MERNKEFDALLDCVGVSMMTTRTSDGHMRSRAMANQKRSPGADMWFVTAAGSAALQDLAQDPHINLSYYKDGTREWISISGTAKISTDRAKIHELYESDWKMWFTSDERKGDPLAGTKDDPVMTLIAVTIHHAHYFTIDRSAPVVAYEMAKGWLTGTAPDLGGTKTLK